MTFSRSSTRSKKSVVLQSSFHEQIHQLDGIHQLALGNSALKHQSSTKTTRKLTRKCCATPYIVPIFVDAMLVPLSDGIHQLPHCHLPRRAAVAAVVVIAVKYRKPLPQRKHPTNEIVPRKVHYSPQSTPSIIT